MKKIFASLTVSGLVLLTVASGGTALAASSTDNPNGPGTTENNISAGTTGEGFVSKDINTPATAKSTAEFTVDPGFLTLDKVPDLNFGTTEAGTLKTAKTLKLSDFKVKTPGTSKNKTAFDGNSNGNVVSDFVGATPIDWQLSASLGEFTGLKGGAELNLAFAGKQTAVTTTDYAVVADNGTVTATDNVYTLAVDKDSTTLTLEKGSVLKTGTYQADLNWQLTNSVTPSAAE